MISPGRNVRFTTAPRLRSRKVPDIRLKMSSCWSWTAVISSPAGRSTSTIFLLVRAPVGHDTMHSPQPTQVEEAIGTSVSNEMLAA